MKNAMLTPDATADLIRSGATLLVAGEESLLRALPAGNWIGGTSVYFLTEEGGCHDTTRLHVTQVEAATDSVIRHLGTEALQDLTQGRFDGGISLVLIPAFSEAHSRFALEAPAFPGLFEQPLMGWITGVALDEVGTKRPAVIDGSTGALHTEGAVVMHVELPMDRQPDIDILNLFEQDMDPARHFTFDQTGFTATTATVNGQTVRLADYIAQQGIDTALPLVADYAGAMVNVSFQSVDATTGEVRFYAPVVSGVDYRLAKPLPDYAATFVQRASGDGTRQMSCNCILNYLHGQLEGKTTGSYTGPATFGEIAYMLLNQTMVRVDLKAASSAAVA